MYLKKNELFAVRVLTLRMKVNAKKAGASRAVSGVHGDTWDIAEYSHMAILSLIDPDKHEREYNREQLEAMAVHNMWARDALETLKHYLREV